MTWRKGRTTFKICSNLRERGVEDLPSASGPASRKGVPEARETRLRETGQVIGEVIKADVPNYARSFERAVPFLLALQLVLGTLQLLDILHIPYFRMIHRATAKQVFSLGFSLLPALLLLSCTTLAHLLIRKRHKEFLISVFAFGGLHLVFGLDVSTAILSVLLVAMVSIRFRIKVHPLKFLVRLQRLERFFFWILVLMIGFQGIALLHWIVLPFGIPSPLAWLAHLELSLFYVSGLITPLIVVGMMCMWFLRPLAKFVRKEKSSQSHPSETSGLSGNEMRVPVRVFVVLALTVAAVGALYPYTPEINPNSLPVGVDVHWYISWMAEVEENLSSAFTVALGSRPTLLMTIYAIEHVFGLGVLEIVKYLPIVLNPLVALSVYFMVAQASENSEWAALSSLFTALGFTATVGMYAYFLANILVLIMIFSALGLLFHAHRTGSILSLVSATVLGCLAVFTHPWTFIQYYAATALFLGYIYFREKQLRKCLPILAFLATTGLVDLLKGVLIGGLEGYGSIVHAAPQFVGIAGFWKSNVFVFGLMYGGFLSNAVLTGSAAWGAYVMEYKKQLGLFLMSLLAVSSPFYFLAKGMAQSRILLNIPFGILAGFGILFLLRHHSSKRETKMALLIFSVVYMTTYLLRSVSNLV